MALVYEAYFIIRIHVTVAQKQLVLTKTQAAINRCVKCAARFD